MGVGWWNVVMQSERGAYNLLYLSALWVSLFWTWLETRLGLLFGSSLFNMISGYETRQKEEMWAERWSGRWLHLHRCWETGKTKTQEDYRGKMLIFIMTYREHSLQSIRPEEQRRFQVAEIKAMAQLWCLVRWKIEKVAYECGEGRTWEV